MCALWEEAGEGQVLDSSVMPMGSMDGVPGLQLCSGPASKLSQTLGSELAEEGSLPSK